MRPSAVLFVPLLLSPVACKESKRAATPVAGAQDAGAAAAPVALPVTTPVEVASHEGREVQVARISSAGLSAPRRFTLPADVVNVVWRQPGELYAVLADHSVHVIQATGTRAIAIPEALWRVERPPYAHTPSIEDELSLDGGDHVILRRCLWANKDDERVGREVCTAEVLVQLTPSVEEIDVFPGDPVAAYYPEARTAPPGHTLALSGRELRCGGSAGNATITAGEGEKGLSEPIWVAHQPPRFIVSKQTAGIDESYLYEACKPDALAAKIVFERGPGVTWAYREESGRTWHIFVDGREVGTAAQKRLAFAPPGDAGIVATSAPSAPAPAPASAERTRALDAIVARQVEAIGAGDAAAFAATFRDDAFVFFPGQDGVASGRASIAAMLARTWGDGRGREARLDGASVGFAPATTDAAWVTYDFTIPAPAGYPVRVTELFEAGPGGWTAVAAHFSRPLANATAVGLARQNQLVLAELPADPGQDDAGKRAELASLLLEHVYPSLETVLIGSDAKERARGEQAVKDFVAGWRGLDLAVDSLRGDDRGGLQWAAANVSLTSKRHGVKIPYRLMLFMTREGGAVGVVSVHFSNGMPEGR